MHLRRALLLFAIVVGLSALIAALFPTDRRDERPSDDPSTQTPTAPPPAPPPAREQAIRLEAGEKPRTETLKPGTRLTLKVAVPKAGEVILQREAELGQVVSAEPNSPAVFDLFLDQPQTFDVTYVQGGAEAKRVGTIAVER